MASPPKKPVEMRQLSTKSKVIGFAAAFLIRLFALTYRWKLEDKAGVSEDPPDFPMIWLFWHNRLFAMPPTYKRYLKSRSGAVMTSASKDGEIVASTIGQFGVSSVRGSSSRGGAKALLEMSSWVEEGYDVAITPDGPRGPRYKLAPGAVKLAQVSGARILPVRIDYSSYWTFKSWDKFRLPRPFCKVTVVIEPCQEVNPDLEGENFEAERGRIESILNPSNEID